MTNKEKLTKWLRDNHSELSWSRTGGDGPQRRDDANYINRSEGYEIRDLIYDYYIHCNIGFKNEYFEITFKKIMNYKKGQKIKRDEMLGYLIDSNKNCKDKI